MSSRERWLRDIIGQLTEMPRELWRCGPEESQQFEAADSTVTGGLAVMLTSRPITHRGSCGSRSFRATVKYAEPGIVPAEDGWEIEVTHHDIVFANVQHDRRESFSLDRIGLNTHEPLGSCKYKSGGLFRRKHPLQLLYEELAKTVPGRQRPNLTLSER
ncbi:MAG: hypothetical protein ABH810_02600 [bacterium]